MRQDLTRTCAHSVAAQSSTRRPDDRSTAAPTPAQAARQPFALAAPDAAEVRSASAPGAHRVPDALSRSLPGRARQLHTRPRAILARSAARPRRAAISTISLALLSSRKPGACRHRRSLRSDTQVLRIDHVRADDLDFGHVLVDGRAGEQASADALPAGSQQCEPTQPASSLEGWRKSRSRGCGARRGRDQLRAVAQAPRRIRRPHADQLQPVGSGEPGRCDSVRPMKSPCASPCAQSPDPRHRYCR